MRRFRTYRQSVFLYGPPGLAIVLMLPDLNALLFTPQCSRSKPQAPAFGEDDWRVCVTAEIIEKDSGKVRPTHASTRN